ncbi:hypothetical protein B296_00025286 [Ensete ventricosum]|uniref:Uncharacterized protein n=1 Tax=Ensete ventricosum TaxID=4639 RepID=A0A426XI51_ENSVE|nr:hypothetical protein B296_00025286 [Ensete ventricosum]
MRLNHVELFYAFLLHFASKGSEERGSDLRAGPLQGRPPTARPLAGMAGFGQGRLQGQPTVASPWLGCGRGCPYGATACDQATRATARGHGARPPTRAVVPAHGDDRPWTEAVDDGAQRCRLRKSCDDNDR